MARKHRWLWLAAILAAGGPGVPARAADLHLEFVEGLRSRGYHDTAVLYLDRIESDPTLPPDVRLVLPYERGVTLLLAARNLGPEARREPLDRALAQFEAFTRANPDHPLAPAANTEQARILLENARLNIWQVKSPITKGDVRPLREDARRLIARARAVFQTAHDQHKAAWESFPVFIPETERQTRDAREQALRAYMQAQLDLAMCTYEEAQTHPPDSAEFKRLLTRAAEEFEAIHTQYRSVVVGLYARMWQAKCFEEQGGREGLGRALGIYNELLGNPGESPTMQRLKGQVRHFWCVCQNQRQEYQLVIQAAEEWIRNNRTLLGQPYGIGIRWELVQALEAHAQGRTLTPRDRERLLRQALVEAERLSQIAGQYRDVAIIAVSRLKAALNIGAGDPRDFETAMGLVRTMIKPGIFDRQQAIEAEKAGEKRPSEIAALEQDLATHLRETARILLLAIELADSRTDRRQLLEAHYLLSYVYYLQDRFHQAGVLAEFIIRKLRDVDPELPLKAGSIAVAAWSKAYYASERPEDERTFEVDRLVHICQLIAEFWPQSAEAQSARMQLGRLFSRRDLPAQAAEWYTQVPESAEQYAEAQLLAGQAYWNAYLKASARRDDERPADPAELEQWQQAAERHLKLGIERVQAVTPRDSEPPVDLVAARVTMAQILVNRGEYEAAVKLLKDEPHAPEQAIQARRGEKRPRTGLTSAAFASLVYQLFLRSYVGTKNIDEALRVMDQLEQTVPEDDDGTALTSIYINLGRELKAEIERLRASPSGNRLTEVLASFEEFLNALGAQRDRMNYSALIWIAETYYYLAEGMGPADIKAHDYYRRAAETYQDILARPSGFIPGDKDLGVKLRLVNCLRSQGEYQRALELVGEVLAEQPLALQAQVEAARVLHSWGDSGESKADQRYLEAIQGRALGENPGAIWGWGGIVRMLSNRPDYREQYLEARLNSAECRREYALSLTSGAKSKAALEQARSELEMFARVSGPEQLGEEWWGRFERMYHSVLRELNQPLTPLPRPPRFVPATRPATTVAERDAADRTTGGSESPKQTVAAVPQRSGSPLPMILGGLLAVAAAGGIVFWMIKSQKTSRPRMAYSASLPTFTPPPGSSAATRSSRSTGGAARRRTASGGGGGGGGAAPPEGAPSPSPAAARPRPRRTGQPPTTT